MALMDRVVLAVDGQQRLALAARLGRDQIAGGDQAFLVRQADGLAGFDGFVGGFQSGDAHDSADHEVGIGMGGDFHRAGRAMQDFNFAVETGVLQPCLKAGRRLRRLPSKESRDASGAPARRRDRRCCPPPLTTTEKRSGKLSTMLSVLLPMEPVEPSMAMRFMGIKFILRTIRCAIPCAPVAMSHRPAVCRSGVSLVLSGIRDDVSSCCPDHGHGACREATGPQPTGRQFRVVVSQCLCAGDSL